MNADELEERRKSEIDKLKSDQQLLDKSGIFIRRMIRGRQFPTEIAASIRAAQRELAGDIEPGDVAVAAVNRVTVEDLAEASFAGQQESYLNVTGQDELLDACRECYASLFTDRAIAFRRGRGFDRLDVTLSVGAQ